MQISTVVFLFRYQLRTALSVGLGMAQIGEFAFVLLSSASQHNLIPYQLYMLLMGAHHFNSDRSRLQAIIRVQRNNNASIHDAFTCMLPPDACTWVLAICCRQCVFLLTGALYRRRHHGSIFVDYAIPATSHGAVSFE